jgi:hypothetical protein
LFAVKDAKKVFLKTFFAHLPTMAVFSRTNVVLSQSQGAFAMRFDAQHFWSIFLSLKWLLTFVREPLIIVIMTKHILSVKIPPNPIKM